MRTEVPNPEFVLQQMHTALMTLTSYEANDTVANSRKNPLEAWRRLQKRFDPTTGERKRNLLRAGSQKMKKKKTPAQRAREGKAPEPKEEKDGSSTPTEKR